MLIEPRLQEDGGGHAIDELSAFARGNAAFAQSPRRLDGRQPLVYELDLASGRVGERLRESARAAGLASLVALSIEWQPYEKSLDALRGRDPNELGDDLARLPSGDGGPRMGYHAELVGHGQPHAYLPEINGRYTHPAASTL